MLIFLLTLIEDPSDEDKLIRLYTKYRLDMIAVAYSILKDYGLAEDVVQDCFIYVVQNIKKFDESKNVRVVLCILTKNRAINKIKQAEKETTSPEEMFAEKISDTYDPETTAVTENSAQLILDWIKTLPGKYHDIVILKYQYGYNDKEVAEILDIKYATVRKSMERIRKKVAEYLREMEEDN